MLIRFANVIFWTCSAIAVLGCLIGLTAIFNGGDKFFGVLAIVAAFMFFMFGVAFIYVIKGPRTRSNKSSYTMVETENRNIPAPFHNNSDQKFPISVPTIALPVYSIKNEPFSNSIDSGVRTIRGKTFIGQVWNGEVPLWITYWFFGFFCSILIRFTSPLLTYELVANFQSIGTRYYNPIIWSWSGLVLVFSIWVWTGVWRSANKYKMENKQKTRWGNLAQASVVLGVLQTFAALGQNLTPERNSQASTRSSSPDQILQEQAALAGLNANLPKKLDSATTLTSIDIIGGHLRYKYNLTFPINDVNYFTNFARKQLLTSCTNADYASYLKQYGPLSHLYTDANGKEYQIVIAPNDCG